MVIRDKIYNMNEQQPWLHFANEHTEVDLTELQREEIMGVKFRGAVDRALDDHRELFAKHRNHKPLSPEEEERFSRLNGFIITAKQIMDDYGDPETY